MAGQYPEGPYPYGDVQHTVVVFIPFTLNNFFHESVRLRIAILNGVGVVQIDIAIFHRSACMACVISRKASTTSSGWSKWIQCALLSAMICLPCNEWPTIAACSAMRTSGWCAPEITVTGTWEGISYSETSAAQAGSARMYAAIVQKNFGLLQRSRII